MSIHALVLTASLVGYLAGSPETVQPETTMAEPAPPPADTLTLDQALRIALAESPTMQQAEAQRADGTAGRWEGWGRLLPSVSLSSGLNQSEVLQQTASDPITGGIIQLPDSLIELRQTFGTQAVLSASWTLFDGGRTVAGIRGASSEARAANLAYEAARVRLAAEVTLAYLDALEARSLEGVRRAEVTSARELARTAVGRFAVGEVPEVDALQARLAASEAEIALMDAEADTHDARLALFEFLGLPGDAGAALAEPSSPDVDVPEEELRRRAMEESAELAALGARREAAARRDAAGSRWYLPAVTVGGTWVRSEFGQTRDALTASPRNEQTFYRLNLSWSPLERPGGTVADRRRSRAELRAADAELDARRASLAREVEGALDRLERARVLRERGVLNLKLAERQLAQATERYRLGAAPLSERLTAEALSAEAARQEIIARYATLRALAELDRAAGVRVVER